MMACISVPFNVYELGIEAPTRKFYMLAHLEPSAEMTGGPWYTDSELDTEFISRLLSACLSFIRNKVCWIFGVYCPSD